jgi:uncharacterized protein YegP (UPF0339 family)
VNPPRLSIYQRADGDYDWRLQDRNGQVVATSGGQGYTRRQDALRALLNVEVAFADPELERIGGHADGR